MFALTLSEKKKKLNLNRVKAARMPVGSLRDHPVVLLLLSSVCAPTSGGFCSADYEKPFLGATPASRDHTVNSLLERLVLRVFPPARRASPRF